MTTKKKKTDLLGEFDVEGLLVVHQAMRNELVRYVAVVPTLVDTERDKAKALEDWFEFIERSLHHHHHAEDTILFPLVAIKDPEFSAMNAQLEEDHEHLVPLLKSVREGLAALAGAPVAQEFVKIRDALSLDLTKASELLHTHLEREEEAVIPRMLALVTVGEMQVLEKKMMKGMTFKDMKVMFPWVMSGANPAQQQRMLDGVPWLVKFLFRRFWNPGFKKMTSPLA